MDKYSDELYQLLLRNSRETRELNKSIRHIDKQLAGLEYVENELSPRMVLNLDFARANMKSNIYDQAVLEGIATTFPQTEEIIDNGIVLGMRPTDVQKILNLKHAWEFILDKDVAQYTSNYYILCHIAKLVNEGFFNDRGRIRGIPVTIGGTSYIPMIPIETVVIEHLHEITQKQGDNINIAIKLCLYCMKTQVFNDGIELPANELAGFPVDRPIGLSLPRLPPQSLRFFYYLKEETFLLSGYLYWRSCPCHGVNNTPDIPIPSL